MIKISQLKTDVNYTDDILKKKIEKELSLKHIFKNVPDFSYKILRRSIDARKKPDIFYVFTVCVDFNNADSKDVDSIILKKCKSKNISKYDDAEYKPRLDVDLSDGFRKRPVIIGEGPCGLFAGLILAMAGLKPVIFERGDKVENRVEKVNDFWLTGSIDDNTNVQYGEGGAGTFSDGKLNTLVKDKSGKNRFVLETFVKYGANSQCAYDAYPHVGTDVLRDVVTNIRNEINRLNGQVIHLCKMTEPVMKNGKIVGVYVDNLSGEEIKLTHELASDDSYIDTIKCGLNYISTDDLVLSIGHSARDTFEMLYDKGILIEQKNFAVGIRIQHKQSTIDDSRYGKGHEDVLPPSPYKVTNHTSNARDVFSFCMCPGGYVVNASSKNGYLCVNGMSYSDRASENANSALICAIDRNDFESDHPLAGMRLQEELEKKAYEEGKGKIPVQLFSDYKNSVKSDKFKSINPMFKGNTEFANIRNILPDSINKAIIESIDKFGYTIEGFDDDDAIIAAVESRTSSPVRIKRDENLESNIKGLYPCGEGAGYAGGIMSAAMDGIRVADKIIDKYSR